LRHWSKIKEVTGMSSDMIDSKGAGGGDEMFETATL